jgi:hypothetical protein
MFECRGEPEEGDVVAAQPDIIPRHTNRHLGDNLSMPTVQLQAKRPANNAYFVEY